MGRRNQEEQGSGKEAGREERKIVEEEGRWEADWKRGEEEG